MTRRNALLAGALLAGAWALVLLLRGPVSSIAELYPDALPPHPYFLPGRALLLWVALPAGIVAMTLALLAPGLLLVTAFGGATSLPVLALKGFGVAFGVRWAVHAAGTLAGVVWTPALFLGADIGLGGVAWLILFLRSRQATLVVPDFRAGPDRRRVLWSAGLAVLAVVALIPLIFWQDLTADGLEAWVIGRSLREHVMPRFPNASGLMGLGIGMSPMAYPVHWFMMLVGPSDAATRLPMALHAPLLFLAMLALIETRSPRGLRPLEEAAVAAVLAAFVAALGFNGSYEPYTADLSAPAAFEALTVFSMSAALLFLWRGETAWLVAFTALTYLARPTGLLFPLLMAAAAVVLPREERRAWLRRLGIAVAVCIGVYLVYEKGFVAASGTGLGYPSESITGRLQYLRFFDVRRFLFVAVPCGLLPVLALAAWRRQDELARALTLFCVAYFLFFYVQAFVALHHFAPLMLLPAVVYWRIVVGGPERRWPAPAALAGALLGVALAIPPQHEVYRAARPIGRELVYEAGDAMGTYREYRAAFQGRAVVTALFRFDADPAKEFTVAPDLLVYYAHRFRTAPEAANYIVRPDSLAPPEGFVRVASERGMTAFVRDTVHWRAQQRAMPSTRFASPVLAVPRETLFRSLGEAARSYDVNLGALPFLWRLF